MVSVTDFGVEGMEIESMATGGRRKPARGYTHNSYVRWGIQKLTQGEKCRRALDKLTLDVYLDPIWC